MCQLFSGRKLGEIYRSRCVLGPVKFRESTGNVAPALWPRGMPIIRNSDQCAPSVSKRLPLGVLGLLPNVRHAGSTKNRKEETFMPKKGSGSYSGFR
jgi:hypothetical protein